MTWLKEKAWPWLKANWKWLLFPIGILVFIAGYTSKSKIGTVSSELLGAAEDRKVIEGRTAGQIVEEKQVRDEKLAKIEKEHSATVSKLTRAQRDQMEKLRNDPDKVNEFLLKVGKDIRGG
jgi:Skp family chaperone for outer membrane proteins